MSLFLCSSWGREIKQETTFKSDLSLKSEEKTSHFTKEMGGGGGGLEGCSLCISLESISAFRRRGDDAVVTQRTRVELNL